MSESETSVHDAVGGEEFFVALVDRFYDGVANEPVLRPMYPDDLSESRRTLRMFLIQYWGGSTAYNEERGHPRLRMRHVPFSIGEPERDAWLAHMANAVNELVDERGLDAELHETLMRYFVMAADHMRNTGLQQFTE